jgi:hypothetical protein
MEAVVRRRMARREEEEKGARARGTTAQRGTVGGKRVYVMVASNSPSVAVFGQATSDLIQEITVREGWMEVVAVVVIILALQRLEE